MKPIIRTNLSLLMFLQYFIWGAWYVTMGNYIISGLKSDAIGVGMAYANLSIAAIISPFFVGLIADRFFSAQKVMGILHLAGALVLFVISRIQDFNTFWWLIFLYTLIYMPTVSLSNSISFSQMKDPGKEFPAIRVLGTIGWIAAGLLVGFMKIESSANTFTIAACASLLLGIFSFLLPDTSSDNSSKSISSILGIDALVLLKEKAFSIFFFTSILLCIPLSFYYGFTNAFLNDIGLENAAGKMTMGQMSEIFFMLLMPLFFYRLGVKKMLLVGMIAWILRYIFFAFGDTGTNSWMLFTGILLHGICYDFFFVTGQIYADNKASEKIKSAMQGMMTFATYGVGMLIGSYASGFITKKYSSSINKIIQYDWQSVWLVPAAFSLLVTLLFIFFFSEKKKKLIE
jgi:nucleoside transporter